MSVDDEIAGESPAILVTGGSGFIGGHLLARLARTGVSLVSVDRRPPREALANVRYIQADVRELSSLDLPPLGRIFNFAAVHTTPGHPDHEYYDTNVTGALEVVKTAEAHGVKEIVFTSSISVYGPSEDRKDETSKPAPISAYGKSKLMAEGVHDAWRKAGPDRRLVTVRPAVVFGRGEGGNFARMAALLRKGFFVFPGRRSTIKSCIFVEDLLDLMLAAAEDRSQAAPLLNGAYPECPSLEQIVTTLQGDYFPKARLLDVPAAVVVAAAKGLQTFNGLGLGVHPDRVAKLMRSTHVYPQWAVDHGLLQDGAFRTGVKRWAAATQDTFV